MTGAKQTYLAGIMVVSATVTAAPARAQQPFAQDQDSLIEASLEVGPGVELARRQIVDADLLGAAATLERVLLVHPAARAPRALYAATLCRLDDPDGAQLEIELLASEPIAPLEQSEIDSACGSLSPAGEGRGQ